MAAEATPGPRQRWMRLESANFTFFSSATERSTRALARDLEKLRTALEVLLPGAELHTPVDTWIYVFEDRIDFAPYRPVFEGRAAQVDGYFLARRSGNFVALNGDTRTDPRRTVLHEYLHEVTRHNLPRLPLWIAEGLAEVYSTFTTRGDGTGIVGLPHREHVIRLRRGPMLPLEELLTLGRGDRAYHRGGVRAVVYAQSWALTHMLLFGDRRGDLDAYLAALARGGDVAGAFRRLFADPEAIENELRRYVRGRFPGTEVPIANANSATETRAFSVVRMAHPEVLWRLGRLLEHIGPAHAESARDHYRAAIEAGTPATADIEAKARAALRALDRRAAPNGR